MKRNNKNRPIRNNVGKPIISAECKVRLLSEGREKIATTNPTKVIKYYSDGNNKKSILIELKSRRTKALLKYRRNKISGIDVPPPYKMCKNGKRGRSK